MLINGQPHELAVGGRVAAHELGHAMGLTDTAHSESTVNQDLMAYLNAPPDRKDSRQASNILLAQCDRQSRLTRTTSD